MDTELYALSTIGMTLYNFLAYDRASRTAMEMVVDPRVQEQHAVTIETVDAALAELLHRGRLKVLDDSFSLVDPKSRLCIKRNQDDDGGWGGWELQNGFHRIPIEEAIQ
jgi:hypothetical protein